MVYRCACRPVEPDPQNWAALLSGRAGKRALRLYRLRGRQLAQSMTAELLCRELFSHLRPGEAFLPEEDEQGKPFLPDCPLFISLSHSKGWAAAAVSDSPVGIDLQEIRQLSDRLLQRCYSSDERKWIAEGNAAERATRLWTMKEAFGKLQGTGILLDRQFTADVVNGRLAVRYGDIRFVFPEAPKGFAFSVCLSEQTEA